MNNLFALLVGIIGIFLIRKFFILLFSLIFKVIENLGGPIVTMSNRIESFLEKELFTNTEFIDELKQLIKTKGGLQDFIKHTSFPIEYEVDYTELEKGLFWYGFKSYAIDSNVGLQLNKNAVETTNSILNFTSFVKLAKMNKLNEKEITYVGNIIFLIILKEFKQFSEKYLLL